MNLAFDVYAKTLTGSRLVRLTNQQLLADSFFRVEWQGTGSGQIVMAADQSEIAYLQKNRYVRVVDLDLGGSGETLGGIFLGEGEFVTLSADEGGGRIFKIGGPGQLSYLHRAIWWKDEWSGGLDNPAYVPRDDGYWHWVNDQYGDIMKRGITEAQQGARPLHPIPQVTYDWGSTTDSNGDAWNSFTGEYTIRVGYNLLNTLVDFIRLGLFVDMDADFAMHLYQNDPGRDLTSASFAAGKVRFAAGTNILADLTRAVQPDLEAATTLVLGKTTTLGAVREVDASSYDVVREEALEYGQSDDAGVLDDAGRAYLAALAAQSDTATFPHPPAAYPGMAAHTAFSPGRPGGAGDYWVGDTVTLHTGTGQWDYNEQAIRVAAINWQLDADNGQWWPRPELGSTYGGFQTGQVAGATTLPTSVGCTCPTPAPGCLNLTPAGYEHWTWEAGQEYAAHPFGAGPNQEAIRDNSGPWLGGSGSYSGDMGSSSGSGAMGAVVAVPGVTYNFSGQSYAGGESWPFVSIHGNANYDIDVQWWDASAVLLQTDVLVAYTDVPGAWRSFSARPVAPAGAAYFTLAQNVGGVSTAAPNRTHIDDIVITVGGGSDPLCGIAAWDGTNVVTYGPGYIPGTSGQYIPAGSQIPPPTAAQVPFTPAPEMVSTTVQAAIDELEAQIDAIPGSGSFLEVTGGGKGTVKNHSTMGASETIDLADGNYHYGTLDANCTLAFTGSTNNKECWFTLELTEDGTGGFTPTWPGSVVWVGGTTPTHPTGAGTTTIYAFFSRDGGTTWFGGQLGAGAGASVTVKDEGSALSTAATSLDFVGAGVTASGTGAAKTITIAGGATASDTHMWRPLMDGAGNVITDAGTGEAIMAFS